MESIAVSEIYKTPENYKNKDVIIEGWVRTVRNTKNLGFMEINDGSCFKNIQVVFENGIVSNFDEVTKFVTGTAVKVTGIIEITPDAGQPFELKASDIKEEGICKKSYPLQKKRHSFEFLRTISHLRPRANTFSAVFRIRSIMAHAIHCFFQERGFIYVNTPIITGSDCEGAGEMFRVSTLDPLRPPVDETGNIDYKEDFFARETNLTVSGQLAAEAFALAYKNVYTFGPAFRAENSNTARHAAEFWMIEPEIAFSGIKEDMQLAEDMIKYVIRYVMDKAPDDMDFFNKFIDKELFGRLNVVMNSDFEHITYKEAVRILDKSGVDFEHKVKWGNDLKTEHERYITEQYFKKPVFVTDYPKDIKAFYMRLNDDNETVAAMDLLVPGVGEIIGGSQREERLEILEKRIKELGIKAEDYWWYMDLRKYGGVKHAGFGLGFERMIMYMTGISNIRDVIPFPRTPKSAEF